MRTKFMLLIAASVIGVVALSLVQGYLIRNTYQLKEQAFVNQSTKALAKVDDHYIRLDSISSLWKDELSELIASYKKQRIGKSEILPTLIQTAAPLSAHFSRIYREESAKTGLQYKLAFQKIVKNILLIDSIGNDTIFHAIPPTQQHFLGDRFDVSQAHRLGSSTSYSTFTFEDTIQGKPVERVVQWSIEVDNYMDLGTWKEDIFYVMKELLLTSVLIFLFVVSVLFYSIKSLIMQKKISDIKTDFINNITHEFKTPLATLSVATSLLQETSSKESQLASTVQLIKRQSKRLQHLMDQVMQNTLGYQEIQLHKKSIDIAPFLEHLLADFALSHQGKSLKVSHQFDLNTPKVSFDPFHLTTAVLNILENAVKYNEDELHIHCHAVVGQHFILSIQDNGIGISSKHQAFLFDKFYRVGNTAVHSVKGLGLGLYYTHQIVQAHEGKLWLESREGEGATFYIQLPLTV